MTAVLEARELERSYGIKRGLFGSRSTLQAVAGVSFSIERGAVLGVVGESGCGKSTLARLLLGIEAPSAGEVLLDGAPLNRLKSRERARKIQIVFQDPHSSLNPRKSIRSILTMPMAVHGMGTARECAYRAELMMERVGLPARVLHSRPSDLSGGQRQRVAIARALVMQPEILICDEPTSALDVSVQSQILNLLKDLRDEFDLTYIMISHNLAVIEHMASRVAVMYLGRIVEENAAAELFRQPQHPYTQALLDAVLTPDPTMGIPESDLGVNLPDPSDPPTGCRFHPRCPQAMRVCATRVPRVLEAGNGRVECHLYDSDLKAEMEGRRIANG